MLLQMLVLELQLLNQAIVVLDLLRVREAGASLPFDHLQELIRRVLLEVPKAERVAASGLLALVLRGIQLGGVLATAFCARGRWRQQGRDARGLRCERLDVPSHS